MTRAGYRSLDALSGEHRPPTVFFAANVEADERIAEFEALRAENAVLRGLIEKLEADLVEARSERDSIAAVRNWDMS